MLTLPRQIYSDKEKFEISGLGEDFSMQSSAGTALALEQYRESVAAQKANEKENGGCILREDQVVNVEDVTTLNKVGQGIAFPVNAA